MSAAATFVDVPTEEKRVRNMVKRVTQADPKVRWRYSAHSNERFPLRVYASARREGDGKGRDILVIAVELFNPADDKGDRLVVSVDIMDDDGVILEQSPRYEVPVPSEAQVLSNPSAEISAFTEQVQAAMQELDQWLTSQAPMIQAALT
jgi:hypothetical protein